MFSATPSHRDEIERLRTEATTAIQQATTMDVTTPQFAETVKTAAMLGQINSTAAMVFQLNLGSITTDGETGTLTRLQRDALNQQRYGKRTSKKKAKQLATKRKIADAARKTTTRTAASDPQIQADKASAAFRMESKRAARTDDEMQAEKDADTARKRATVVSIAGGRAKHTADFAMKKITADTNFDGYTTNPETAVCLLHANSGTGRWSQLETIHRERDLRKEVGEVFQNFPQAMRAHWQQQARDLSEDEKKELRFEFNKSIYGQAELPRELRDQFRAAFASGCIETMQKVSKEICGVMVEQSSDEEERAHWEAQRDKD